MMIKIPQQIIQQFDTLLDKEKISFDKQNYYRKWLRYYLDFCYKYNHDPKQTESLPEFINKLRDKKQSKQQQKQAFDSIIIYYKLFNIYPAWSNKTGDNEVKEQIVSYGQNKSINTGRWDCVYNQLSYDSK